MSWILVALLAAGCNSNRIAGPSQARSLADFEARLERIRQDLKIPGMSAAVARDGEIFWSRGFGVSDVTSGAPVTTGTSFHAASLTKTFAATVLLRLVEQGKVSLDDPVTQYGINNLESPGIIRVRHLLSMTSEGVPGQSFKYNGDRFGLLGNVIRSASGRTFAQLVVDSIVTPLGLTHTAPNVANPQAFNASGRDAAAFTANLAKPYALQDGRIVPSTYPNYFGPAAGLITSAEDLARFSIALDRDRLLRPETRALMFAPIVTTRGDTLPYAQGWFSQRYRGVRVVWVYGYWTGNSSLLIKIPERGLTFVLLANTDQLSARWPLGAGRLLDSTPARLFLDSFVFAETPITR